MSDSGVLNTSSIWQIYCYYCYYRNVPSHTLETEFFDMQHRMQNLPLVDSHSPPIDIIFLARLHGRSPVSRIPLRRKYQLAIIHEEEKTIRTTNGFIQHSSELDLQFYCVSQPTHFMSLISFQDKREVGGGIFLSLWHKFMSRRMHSFMNSLRGFHINCLTVQQCRKLFES